MSEHEKFKKDLNDRTEILYRTNETIREQLRDIIKALEEPFAAVDRQALAGFLSILIYLFENEKDVIRGMEDLLIEKDKAHLETLEFMSNMAKTLTER